jgi:hypothetical protein
MRDSRVGSTCLVPTGISIIHQLRDYESESIETLVTFKQVSGTSNDSKNMQQFLSLLS